MARRGVVSLDTLRARIREMEGSPAHARRVCTGVTELDGLVEGLPQPGVVEICGPLGSGRTRLALAMAREALGRHERVAWVDTDHRLYAPGIKAMGIPLEQLLVARPGVDRVLWTTEQLLGSGCFRWVFASDPPPLGRGGLRWKHAAERGRCTLVVVRQRPHRDLPSSMRIAVGRSQMMVVRDSGQRIGQSGPLPPGGHEP